MSFCGYGCRTVNRLGSTDTTGPRLRARPCASQSYSAAGVPRHDHGGNALSADSKQPSGGLASFPDVEGVDQVITSPRHVDIRVGSVLRERTPHHVEALVNANRAAPACRARMRCCSAVGLRQNLNVECRFIAPALSHALPTRRPHVVRWTGIRTVSESRARAVRSHSWSDRLRACSPMDLCGRYAF